MSASDQEQTEILMDVHSGDKPATAPEPVGKREMLASDQEENKLVMDVDSGNQQATTSGHVDEQATASEPAGQRYVKNS